MGIYVAYGEYVYSFNTVDEMKKYFKNIGVLFEYINKHTATIYDEKNKKNKVIFISYECMEIL